jgi:hypothetical protein
MTEEQLKQFAEWLKEFTLLDQSDDFNKGMVAMAVNARNYIYVFNKNKDTPPQGQI